MKPALAGDAPYRVPRENRQWPALALAVAMHAGLLVALWIGVQWQSSEPVAVEAEVWDMKVEAAAPLAPPVPEPSEAPPPAKAPAPAPKPAVAEPIEAPPVVKAPDIALERRKLKEAKDKLAEMKLKEQEKREAQEKADKADAKVKADAKAESDAKAKADAKARADKDLLDNADKLAKAKRAAADQKAADDARRSEMSRITGAVGSGGTGSAAKSTGPRTDDGYVAAIQSKIKSNLTYFGSTDLPGNPRAEFKIDQLPTGEIISVRKIKSSGVPAYDSAVENAITKSSPLPKKKDGTVEREVVAGFNMKDLK